MGYSLARSTLLHNVPQRKVVEALEHTIRSCKACSLKTDIKVDQGVCAECAVRNKAIKRYDEANIPVRYWNLEMKDFKGDVVLFQKYEEIVADLGKAYLEGMSVNFAGTHGIGKTMTCCNILKRATEKGFSAVYVNLGTIVEVLTSFNSDERSVALNQLRCSDFICIDEFDSRFMPSDKSSDLYGRALEDIFRTRHQNSLPIMMCTNSPNIIENFQGQIKDSISSLMSTVKTIVALGKDQRKIKS